MRKPIFPEITESVIAAMRDAPDPRIREAMTILIRHLHDAVREMRLTEEEWAWAIDFLTRTGQMSTGSRQEFILLSDTLGVSMLVDAINHDDSSDATASTVFGPFYAGLQPELPAGHSILKRPEPGEDMLVAGHVFDAAGAPLAGALVEVWQTAPNGLYDVQDPEQPQGHVRASFRTGADGGYSFRTVLPISYPIPDDGPVGQMLGVLGRHPNRPAHIHFMIGAPGHRRLVTHIFVADDAYLASDAVFGVKPSLIAQPERDGDGLSIHYDFRLARNGRAMAGNAAYWQLRPNAPAAGALLGPAGEVPEGGAKAYRFGRGRSAVQMFVVRHEGQVRGYLNICPHFSRPLNHDPDAFLADGLIVCVRHFARFRPHDGLCVEGACEGSHLDPVPVVIDAEGMLRIGTEPQ
jgi:hydroxyquinol 1,2-dioxygenase